MVMSELQRKEDLCSTLQRETVALLDECDFEEMHKEGGGPPISPRTLLMVTVLQFLE